MRNRVRALADAYVAELFTGLPEDAAQARKTGVVPEFLQRELDWARSEYMKENEKTDPAGHEFDAAVKKVLAKDYVLPAREKRFEESPAKTAEGLVKYLMKRQANEFKLARANGRFSEGLQVELAIAREAYLENHKSEDPEARQFHDAVAKHTGLQLTLF